VIFLIDLGMLTFQGFTTPAMLASGYTDVLGPEESFTFVPPHDYLLPPRLPASSQDYLLPPTTACRQTPVPRCACLEKDLRRLASDCFYGV